MKLVLCVGLIAELGCGGSAAPDASTAPDLGSPVTDSGVVSLDARGDSGGLPDYGPFMRDDAGPSSRTCETLYGQRVCWGTVLPSTLGAGVRDLTTLVGDVGYHFYCAPEDAARWNQRVLVHIVGTGDNPGRSNGFLKRACALGFVGLSPMYENVDDARGTCREDSACFENFRREIVYGGDLTPDPIRVDAANSLLARLDALVDHAARTESGFASWSAIATKVRARDFTTFVLSGHSQGSGHALLLARDFQAERLIMMGGLTDRLMSGTPGNAPVAWVSALATSPPRTPVTRMFAYNHEDDSIATYAQVLANYDVIGVPAETCDYLDTGTYPASCHRVRNRAQGCTGFLAHASLLLRRFGSVMTPCSITGQLHDNAVTWEFLLTTP